VLALIIGLLAWSAARADEAEDTKAVKQEIQAQIDLIKADKADELKKHFTERQRKKLTAEIVAAGKKEVEKYTLDDLIASVGYGEFDGKKTAKIKMKNGRTLTTLMLVDGKWLADTIWFK
jgi:broad specificity phosphatase PhoE